MVTIPKTLEEALELLNQQNLTIMAGGTDLMVQNRSWNGSIPDFSNELLFIKHIDGLSYIKQIDNMIHIGALTTLEDLLQHDITPNIYKDALYEMASINIRNEATIAGNIENASPAGDSLPVLYALDAIVVLQSATNKRELLLQDYITGVRRTLRQPNELITEVKFPIPNYTNHKWVKVGGRRADAISKVSFVGLASIQQNIVQDVRIALGAVSPVVLRQRDIEQQYIGLPLNELKARISELIALYEPFITPIDDQRSNKAYRTTISKNLIRDFVESL